MPEVTLAECDKWRERITDRWPDIPQRRADDFSEFVALAVASVTAPQFHCGHPVACLVDDGDGTQHCAWCAAEAEEQKACAERVWQVLVQYGVGWQVRTEVTAAIRKEKLTRERL